MENAPYSEALQSVMARQTLAPRTLCYMHKICNGQGLGYRKHVSGGGSWIARYRTKSGRRREKFLGYADDIESDERKTRLTFAQAVIDAKKWFNSPEVRDSRVDGFPLGRFNELCACPVGDTYTVLQAMHDFIEYRRGFRASSNHIPIVYMANAYIVPLIGQIPLDDLSVRDVRSVALEVECTVAKRGSNSPRLKIDPSTLSPEARRRRRVTANNTLSVLRSALKMAYLAGRTKNDGCWKYASGFKTVHQARVRYFTWTEARKIIASARPDLRNLVLAALYTGARLSEILDIRAADLMEKRMAVYIKPQKTYRGRTVALPQEGYDFLKSLSRDKGTNDRLFTRYDGGLFTTSYVAAHFRKLMDKLGFSRENVYHCLRHTYASLLIQAGTPPIVVARQLGHLNMQTVIKHYAHVSDDFYDVELRSKFNPQLLTPDLFD